MLQSMGLQRVRHDLATEQSMEIVQRTGVGLSQGHLPPLAIGGLKLLQAEGGGNVQIAQSALTVI